MKKAPPAPLAERQEIVGRVGNLVSLAAVANLEEAHRHTGTVLQVMRSPAGREARAVAGSKDNFHAIANHENGLTLQHKDELVLAAMSMMQRGAGSRLQLRQVYAEVA